MIEKEKDKNLSRKPAGTHPWRVYRKYASDKNKVKDDDDDHVITPKSFSYSR